MVRPFAGLELNPLARVHIVKLGSCENAEEAQWLDRRFLKRYLTSRLFNLMVQHSQISPDLGVTFAALADPTRRAILARLTMGEATVTTLAEPFEMSGAAISKHLKVLERAGLISRGRQAQWRPCRLNAAPLKDTAGWIEHYRRFWEESFDRLDDYLREVQKRELKSRVQPKKEKKHGRRK
jgi:DNA-binding transcriptional ArsR family regulator